MGATRWVHLDVERVMAVTDKAILLRVDGEDYWIPCSQMSDYEAGDGECSVSITEWIARQKGLLDE